MYCRYKLQIFVKICTEYLQERLSRETSHPEFSEMPFRFTEIAKVLLDVLVVQSIHTICYIDCRTFLKLTEERQMTFKTLTKSDLYWKTFGRHDKPRVEKVSRGSITTNSRCVTFVAFHIRVIAENPIQLANLCAMEINEIRPFFVRAMGVLTQLTREPAPDQMDMTWHTDVLQRPQYM